MLVIIITFMAAGLLLPSIGIFKIHRGTYYGRRRTYASWLRSRSNRFLSH